MNGGTGPRARAGRGGRSREEATARRWLRREQRVARDAGRRGGRVVAGISSLIPPPVRISSGMGDYRWAAFVR